MSIYDALDNIPTGLVALSIDVPGWAIVNLDTGKVERWYVESQELGSVAAHQFVPAEGDPYFCGYEAEYKTDDRTASPSFGDEIDSKAVLEKAAKILNDQGGPDLEILR